MTGNFLLCEHLGKDERVCMVVTPLAGLPEETALLCTQQETIFQLSSLDSLVTPQHTFLYGDLIPLLYHILLKMH